MDKVIEIRSYYLQPNVRATFHELMVQWSVPLLRSWNVDVVAFGPSLHDQDSYYLIRAYDSLEARKKSQDAFYASAEWREGPREAILPLIDSYTSVVIAMNDTGIDALRPPQQ
jgi:hypothetical protein